MTKSQFDFNTALEQLQAGQGLTGKDGVLTPLIKQLTEAAVTTPRPHWRGFSGYSANSVFHVLLVVSGIDLGFVLFIMASYIFGDGTFKSNKGSLDRSIDPGSGLYGLNDND